MRKPPPDIATIHARLGEIFPEGLSDRNYLVREMAAKAVFVFLYIDAVEGADIWLAPKHIYRMTDEQATLLSKQERSRYRTEALKPGFQPEGNRWYADNTREPIRDETLKEGLVVKGAVVVNENIPTTSSRGRYALEETFADLFLITDLEFPSHAAQWREQRLNKGALAKIRILRDQKGASGVIVRVPNGETRTLEAGPSAAITKAVVEEFAIRFLSQPAVIWISESGHKVVLRDAKLMGDLGLDVDQSTLLPDLVMADLGRNPILLIFVEVVASDGPVTEARKQAIWKIANDADYAHDQIAFLSAFEHRGAAPFKRRLDGIAKDSAVWCMAEPDVLVWIGEKETNPFPISKRLEP
jgi:hypothetical protein